MKNGNCDALEALCEIPPKIPDTSLIQSQLDYARECWPWDAPWCRMFNLETWDNEGEFRSDATGTF